MAARPFHLVQLSDLHIGANWAPGDPLARFRSSVAAIRRHPTPPDSVVVSGDLADHGAPDEYALIKEELATLGVPVNVIPGNHDDRRGLRSCFGLPGEDEAPVYYTADMGPLRLVLLDSTIPGEDGGDLGPEQLAWLRTTLAAAPKRPTLLVMHHPPLLTGVGGWDKTGLAEAARVELVRLVAQHSQVYAILAGHHHWTTSVAVAGSMAFIAPSTYVQTRPGPAADPDRVMIAAEEPPAFALHTLRGGELVSRVHPVTGSAA